jgi:hypothetical protein
MINKFSLGEDFSQALDKFIQSTVSIDGKRRDRNFKTKSLQKT